MSDDSARDSLPRFLARRARDASDGRLALHTAAGLIAVAAAATVIRYPYSLIVAGAGACFLAFGSWGIADRELAERQATMGRLGGTLLLALRAVATVLGVVGALALIFGGLFLALGTWIS